MFDKNNIEQILKEIVWLNTKMGVWSFIIPIIFAVTVLLFLYRAYKKPSQKNTKILLSIYAIIYLFSGYTLFMGKNFMGLQEAIIGAVALWSVSIFLILDIIFKWTEIKLPKKTHLKIISLSLIFAGIVLYPLLEIALGFTYPRMVFFGAECPTTISLIGLFIGSIPKVNKPLFILISVNAIFVGFSVAINGATFDYLYGLAGVFGILMLTFHFNHIFK